MILKEFLIAIIATLVINPTESSFHSKRDTNIYDVVVVGGGVAGLTTCSRLAQKGIKNILLLEASDRLGGRVNTIQHSNLYFVLFFDFLKSETFFKMF